MDPALKEKLENLVKAASEFSDDWLTASPEDNDALNEGYPIYLGSFDEFVADLNHWLFSATNAKGGK